MPEDLVGATIRHLYTDQDSCEDVQWRAQVVDIDIDSENKENPEFFILYEEDDVDNEEKDPEYFLEPLIQDYLNGWVQLVDVDSEIDFENDEA